MRDEKEERKKQARSNKQTRQSNKAHPRQSHVNVNVLPRNEGYLRSKAVAFTYLLMALSLFQGITRSAFRASAFSADMVTGVVKTPISSSRSSCGKALISSASCLCVPLPPVTLVRYGFEPLCNLLLQSQL